MIGNGISNTIIQGGVTASTGIDKVLSFNPLGMQPGFASSISGLTIQFGRNPVTDFGNNEGGGLDFDGGADDGAGSLVISNCQILQNATTDGDGGGVALLDGGSVTITDTMISGNQSKTQRAALYYIGEGGGVYVGPAYPFQLNLTMTNSTISAIVHPHPDKTPRRAVESTRRIWQQLTTVL